MSAERLAAALTEVVDARRLWVDYGDGSPQRPTCNIDRLDAARAEYDAALVERVTEIAATVVAQNQQRNDERAYYEKMGEDI